MLLNKGMVNPVEVKKYLLLYDGHSISLSFEKLSLEDVRDIAITINANHHITHLDIQLNDWQSDTFVVFLQNLISSRFISLCWRVIWQTSHEIEPEVIHTLSEFIDREPNLRAFDFHGISLPEPEAQAIQNKIQHRLHPVFNNISSVWNYAGKFHNSACKAEERESMADEALKPAEKITYAIY